MLRFHLILAQTICMIWLCTAPSLFAQAQISEYEKFYQQAIAHFNENNPQAGFINLDQALEIKPDFYDALYARSYYLMQEGRYREALPDYYHLIELRPQEASLYLYRGQAFFYLEYFERAEQDYLQAYALDSTHLDICNSLGSLYYILELYQDALIYLNQAVKIDQGDFFSHYYRAHTYYYLENYTLALQDLATCLTIEPDNIEAHRLKALVYIGQKKYKSAVAEYENLEKRNIDFEVDDFLHWGIAQYRLGRYDDAFFYLSLPEEHKSVEIYHQQGKAKYAMNESNEALIYFNKALDLLDSLDESSAAILYDRAVVKHRLRDVEGAKKDFFFANYLMPEIAQQLDYEGKKIELLANAFILLKIDQQQTILDSVHLKGYQHRAEAFSSSGETYFAIQEAQKALALDSSNSYTYTIFATIAAMNGQYDEALAYIDQALRLPKAQTKERNIYIQSLVYMQQKRYNDALESLNQAIALAPRRAALYSDRSYVEHVLGNTNRALIDINRAIELSPDELAYYNDRAYYNLSLKAPQKVIEDANFVLGRDAENVVAFYNRGLAYKELKAFEKAESDFLKVLQLMPEDEEVRELLAEVQGKLK